MSKKKNKKQKIANEKDNLELEQSKKTTNNKSKKRGSSLENSPNVEELLKIEKDKNLRLFAEFENFRKRTAKDRIEVFSTANKDIMTILLPILDNFERSIKANNYSEEDGPALIYNQLRAELNKKGLTEMENPIGKELDTNSHEAISNMPAPTDAEKGKIMDVVEKGYLLGEKVLRYAKVVVANKE